MADKYSLMHDVDKAIIQVPDFPRKGITFLYMNPVYGDAKTLRDLVIWADQELGEPRETKIVVPEARAYILGGAIAAKRGKGIVPIRKAGKTPVNTVGVKYEREYGPEQLELDPSLIKKGDEVVIFDDVRATGNTDLACASLVQEAGGKVRGFLSIAEISFLKPMENIKREYPNAFVKSLLRYVQTEDFIAPGCKKLGFIDDREIGNI